MKKKVCASAAIACLAASNALAVQPAGAYVGVLAGSTDISRNLTGENFQTNEFTWGALLGFQLNQYFAVEIEYLKPNDVDESNSVGPDTVEVSASSHAWSAAGLLTYPLNARWSVHARLGAVQPTGKYAVSINDGELFGSLADDKTKLLYGAGLSVRIQRAQLRIDYRRADIDYGSFGTLSFGVNWHFSVGTE